MTRKHLYIMFGILLAVVPDHSVMSQNYLPEVKNENTSWILSNLTKSFTKGVRIAGKPGILNCKFGDAITFNGSSDAIFLDNMPLTGLEQFTIEVIFRPAGGGNFEQRFLHFGESQGDRVLLELRANSTDWYFDAFIAAGEQKCALIDPSLLHPLDQWYHVAYVIDKGKLETYVNGKKELEGNIILSPLTGGKTSIGVRQNENSWFRGAIYRIRISPEALKPSKFLDF